MGIHTRAANLQAREWLKTSIELNPTYGEPHGLLAFAYQVPRSMGWYFDPSLRGLAAKHAQKCVELNSKAAVCRCALTTAALDVGDAAEGVRQGELAVDAAPGLFLGQLLLGAALVADGQVLRTLEHTRKGLRLGPLAVRFPTRPLITRKRRSAD